MQKFDAKKASNPSTIPVPKTQRVLGSHARISTSVQKDFNMLPVHHKAKKKAFNSCVMTVDPQPGNSVSCSLKPKVTLKLAKEIQLNMSVALKTSID